MLRLLKKYHFKTNTKNPGTRSLVVSGLSIEIPRNLSHLHE